MSSARNIVPQAPSGQFPGCALSCATLLSAQQVCLPPYQPQSAQLTYDTCFCNSAFLTPFATTADSVCIVECPIQADRQQLQAWYNGFCAQVRQGIDPVAGTTTASAASNPTNTATVVATTGASTVVSTATVSPTSSSTSSQSQSTTQQPWIDNHWKYVVMIVVVAIVLALLAVVAVWLKRRHRRKVARERAAASGFAYDPEKRSDNRSSATTGLWGPHQMMHATRGFDYAPELVEGRSRKSKSRRNHSKRRPGEADKTPLEKGVLDQVAHFSKPTSRRARPSELETNANMIRAADKQSKSRGKQRESLEPQAVDASTVSGSRFAQDDRIYRQHDI